MRINGLKLQNVRNHKSAEFEITDETIFTGVNGSGKTTILESIYMLLALRGFKKQPAAGVLSFNETFMNIEGEILENNGLISDIVLKYDGKKSVFIDNKMIENAADFIFERPIVCYSPENLGILSPSQPERRAFIDRFVFYSNKNHINDIRIYNHYIMQKAAEFEKENPDKTYVEILNESIVKLSKDISERRKSIINLINGSLENIYKVLEFPTEKSFISYFTNINDLEILSGEKYRKRCDFGVHRDRIEMSLGQKRIEKFSSTGQKKTFILLCLYSFLKYIEDLRKISIITLLDDFEAALDKTRAGFLKTLFSEGRQAIYTGAEDSRLGFKNTILLQG